MAYIRNYNAKPIKRINLNNPPKPNMTGPAIVRVEPQPAKVGGDAIVFSTR